MAKVYVSSTIADMQAERAAVLQWLRAARHQAIDSYLPSSDTVRESCVADVAGCDLYVLILGHRYGHQPQDDNPRQLSITQLEYEEARRQHIPIVALLRTAVPDVGLSDLLDPARLQLVQAFRKQVEGDVRAAPFGDLATLVQGLSTGVQAELARASPASAGVEERWLAAQLAAATEAFDNHMASHALRSGESAKAVDLELFVVERRRGHESDDSAARETDLPAAQPLKQLLQAATEPLLVLGEGGGGKTTSLLHAAATLAQHAALDNTAAVPVYVNLARATPPARRRRFAAAHRGLCASAQ